MQLNVEKMLRMIRGYTNQRTADSDNAFFKDSEIIEFMESSWNDLYAMMTNARENYFQKRIKKVITGQGSRDTPVDILIEDLYKILKIDFLYGSEYKVRVRETDFRSENRLQNNGVYYYDSPYIDNPTDDQNYRSFIVHNNDQVRILPSQNSQGTYEITYVPSPPPLQVMQAGELIDNPVINIPKLFDMWIILCTAIDIGIPEEGDLKNLMDRKNYYQGMINDYMASKTNLYPKRVHKTLDFMGLPLGYSRYGESNGSV